MSSSARWTIPVMWRCDGDGQQELFAVTGGPYSDRFGIAAQQTCTMAPCHPDALTLCRGHRLSILNKACTVAPTSVMNSRRLIRSPRRRGRAASAARQGPPPRGLEIDDKLTDRPDRSLRHQSARLGIKGPRIERRQAQARGQYDDEVAIDKRHGVRTNNNAATGPDSERGQALLDFACIWSWLLRNPYPHSEPLEGS